jgi:hypothetical protein
VDALHVHQSYPSLAHTDLAFFRETLDATVLEVPL